MSRLQFINDMLPITKQDELILNGVYPIGVGYPDGIRKAKIIGLSKDNVYFIYLGWPKYNTSCFTKKEFIGRIIRDEQIKLCN